MPDISGPYLERVESYSPSDAGFALEGGQSSVTIDVANTEFIDKIREILGDCRVGVDGRLKRVLPKANGAWPWHFPTRITSIRGIGAPVVQTASDPFNQLEAAAFDYYGLYPKYRITVNFEPRPYVLTTNDQIQTETITYTKPDGTTENRAIAHEWKRFTDYEYQPLGQYLTAQQGQFLFRVGSAAAPDSQPAGTGQIRMMERKIGIKFRWFNVPYELIDRPDTDNWILEGLGCVNQFDWYRWGKGTLLFQGVTFRRYTPAVPDVEPYFGIDSGDTIIFTNNKLCDIEFSFLYMNPTRAADPPAITNANHIPYGHNLAPFGALQGHYYVTTELRVATIAIPGLHDQPIYPSYPFECLFSVPS